MRWLLAVMICCLLVPSPVAAQAPAEGRVLDDAPGDGRYHVADNDAAEAVLVGVLDLTGLVIQEGLDNIAFRIEHGADDVEVPLHQSVQYEVRFRHGDVHYLLLAYRNMYLLAPVEEVATRASLYSIDPGTEGRRLLASDLETAAGPEHTQAVVPRSALLDERGATLAPGRALEDFSVRSSATFHEGPFLYPLVPVFASIAGQEDTVPDELTRAGDRMPDTGNGTEAWAIQLGGEDAFYTSLTSTLPFRTSNGEATTFVYELDAVNLHDEAGVYRLSVEGVPSAWDVWFPDREVHLEPGEARTVGMVAHVPFAHQHGERIEMSVHLERLDDPRYYARETVGVVYPAIAQPAGHHDTLWFHALETYTIRIVLEDGESIEQLPEGWFYMNTAKEDERDEAKAFGSHYIDSEYRYGFPLVLSPGLAMGLDVDGQRTGSLEATLSTELRDVTGVGLSGALLYRGPEGTVVLADVVPESRADIGRDTTGTVTSTIVPKVDDPIHYAKGASLTLVLTPDYQPGPEEQLYGARILLHPGGHAVLPLEEYHADVSQALGLDPSLQLHVPDPLVVANPGDRVGFTIHVTNQGPETADVSLALRGPGSEEASVSPPRLVGVSPGETRTARVAATLPDDVADGQTLELILEARRGDDMRSLVRLVARADTSEPITPEAVPGLEEHRETPAPPTWPALLAAFWAIRRRAGAPEPA